MQELKELFHLWNDKYFQGKIAPQVSLHFYTRKGSRLGYFQTRFLSKAIFVNLHPGYAWSPRTMVDHKHTLLHEMVHAFLSVTRVPSGHTPLFKRMLKDLTEKEFGFRPTGNVRFHVHIPENFTVPAPIQAKPVLNVPMPVLAPKTGMYKVLSNGKVGTFLKETMVYGRKYIVLQIEGMLFPFQTELTNVQAL